MKASQSITSYFGGVVAEMRKVTWPTMPVLLRNFFSVVLGVGLATVVIGLIDYLFLQGLSIIFK